MIICHPIVLSIPLISFSIKKILLIPLIRVLRMSGPQRKNLFKIEPFKQRVELDPNYSDKAWKILEHAIHEIYSHNASGLSFEELYRYRKSSTFSLPRISFVFDNLFSSFLLYVLPNSESIMFISLLILFCLHSIF